MLLFVTLFLNIWYLTKCKYIDSCVIMLNGINGVRSSKFLMLRAWYEMLVLDDMIVRFSSVFNVLRTLPILILYTAVSYVSFFKWYDCKKKCFCLACGLCGCANKKVCYVWFLVLHTFDVWRMCVVFGCISFLCWDGTTLVIWGILYEHLVAI